MRITKLYLEFQCKGTNKIRKAKIKLKKYEKLQMVKDASDL